MGLKSFLKSSFIGRGDRSTSASSITTNRRSIGRTKQRGNRTSPPGPKTKNVTSKSKSMNNHGDENHSDQEEDYDDDGRVTIPPSIWIDHVFGYLDRQTQNRLCEASKDVYEGINRLQVPQSWPHNNNNNNNNNNKNSTKFRLKKVVTSISFSPKLHNGYLQELAFVTSNSKVVNVWNSKHGYEQTLVGHTGQCSDVTYGQTFLVSSSRTDGTVRLWVRHGCGDDPTYRNYRILDVRVFGTLFVRVSPDNERIASFGNDGNIYVSDVRTGGLIASTAWRDTLMDHVFLDCYKCVAFPSRRHDMLAHTFNNQEIKLYYWKTRTRVTLDDNDPTRLREYKAYVSSIQFVETDDLSSDGITTTGCSSSKAEYLAVGCAVARVKLWRLEDYTCIRTIQLGNGWSAVKHLVFSLDGRRMACTGDGSQIRVFDVRTGDCLKRIEGHKNKVNTLCFSPDAMTLASGSNDRTMRLHAVP